jgi:hypothetical protein
MLSTTRGQRQLFKIEKCGEAPPFPIGVLSNLDIEGGHPNIMALVSNHARYCMKSHADPAYAKALTKSPRRNTFHNHGNS